jgi:signal transduction histidine kinase
MKIPSHRPRQLMVVVSALVGILVILAVLQYRWIGQVSEADRERLQARLQTSISQFRQEFNRELLDVCMAFRRDRTALTQRDWRYYAQRYEYWLEAAPYPELVANLYIWQADRDGDSPLLQFNRATGEFEAVPPAERLERVLPRLAWRPGERGAGWQMRSFQWALAGETPMLVQALIQFPFQAGGLRRPILAPAGYFVIELSLNLLRRELLPEMAGRYFASTRGFDYHVAVLSGHDPGAFIYRSDPELPAEAFASSDARVSLPWGLVPNPARIASERQAAGLGTGRGGGRMLLTPEREEYAWVVAVKHRQGSLDEAVASLRRRNLAISFGVLLLLGLSAAMIIVSTQRAQRLARLQMEFVAGVSHELRTPLAVICSAGDNLAEGVVDSTGQVREYGALIRKEGRRLSEMVEQTLQFAALEAGRRQYNLQPVAVAGIIAATLAEAEPMIQAAGFTVEKTVDPGLPLINADAAALAQCLQNLITNALKYGGESRWMAVRARAVPAGHGLEVQLTVEDKGPGIEPADLPRIFEPFYQGRPAGAAKSRGAGLGLSLARDAIEAMGGSITVKGAPGQGSAFTLHLPALGRNDTENNGT